MEAQQNSLLKPDSSGDLYVCVLVGVRAQAVLCFNVIVLSAKGISDPRFHLVEEYFFLKKWLLVSFKNPSHEISKNFPVLLIKLP